MSRDELIALAERCEQCGKRGGGHHPACILTPVSTVVRIAVGRVKCCPLPDYLALVPYGGQDV